MSYGLVLVDRIEPPGHNPGFMLEKPGELLLVFRDEANDRWVVEPVTHSVAFAMAPDRAAAAFEAWKLHHRKVGD